MKYPRVGYFYFQEVNKMMIVDMISEMALKISNGYAEEMKKDDPEKFDQLEKLFNNLIEVSIHMLKVSPEFRKQFARIHAEFMKHPECAMVIEGAVEAVEQYKPEIVKH